MIHFSNVSKQYGGQVLYRDASFVIRADDKIGLVGPNGAGKTTIFRLIMKEEGFDGGQITYSDKIKIAYFSQNVGDLRGRSALAEVMSGDVLLTNVTAQMREIEKKLEEGPSDDEMEKLLDRLGKLQEQFEELGGYEQESRAQEILTGLGIMPEDQARPVESFSGGWKMRIALAKVLSINPQIVLMDEPTNYLDMESIMWLEGWLKSFKGAVVMTSHDRDFMNAVVKTIVEVANKTVTTYSGNYEFYLKEKDVRWEQQKAQFERQQDMLAKEEEFIARFAARASHAAQVQSRVKKLDKIDRVEMPVEERTIEFSFPKPPRSGNDVVKIQDLGKSWKHDDGREKPVFAGLTATVRRGEHIGVLGINGAGKSTLLKVIAGLTPSTHGRAELGANVFVGYFSQFSLDVLDPKSTVFEEVRSRIPADGSDGYVRNLLAAFLFRGDDVDKKVSVLSGGEKSRLILATILSNPLNLLILDEPTNHLDIRSREVLLDALKVFEGTVLLVSHDRHFHRAVSNRIFEVDRGGIQIFEGNFDYYLEKKGLSS